MFEAAKYVSAFWFPREMAQAAAYYKLTQGQDFAAIDPRRIVSRDMLDGDRELASAAPDLAASVEYHAPRADRAEAMLAGCACRTERPTVAEVRAATLGHGGGVIELLCKVPLKSTPRGDYRLVVAWVGVRCGVVVGLNTKSVNALRDATGYLFLTPDGPLSWARVAELVAEMEGGR